MHIIEDIVFVTSDKTPIKWAYTKEKMIGSGKPDVV